MIVRDTQWTMDTFVLFLYRLESVFCLLCWYDEEHIYLLQILVLALLAQSKKGTIIMPLATKDFVEINLFKIKR